MVGGLEKFREAFADFSDNFVIIGGTACDEVLAGTAMRPRPTLDIDIIVIVENMTADFANAFWQFITAGNYRPGVRKNDDNTTKYVLYSFTEVNQEVIDTVNEFSERLLASLPNQSLSDAMRANEETLRLYLETLPTFYIAAE